MPPPIREASSLERSRALDGKQRGRNYGLDIARSIAVTTVVVSHLGLEPAAKAPMAVTALVYAGSTAVELFFSLSGFLIGGLLIELAHRDIRPGTVLDFLFRRWMRTLPLYYAVLWWTSWFFHHQQPHAWFFLQNFYPGEVNLIPAAWSLVLEEYFYFFFPLTMLALSALLGGGTRLVGITAALLILVCTAGRLGNAYGFTALPWDVVHNHPFMRMDCAAYGVLAACLYRSHPLAVARALQGRSGAVLLGCTALAIAWGGLFIGVLHLPPAALAATGYAVWGPPWFALQHSFLDLIFAVAVLTLFVTAPRPLAPGAGSWCIRQCSAISYSLYLVHMLVMTLVEMYLRPTNGLVKVGEQLAGAVVVAVSTYLLIERPFLALRNRLSRAFTGSAADARPIPLMAEAGRHQP